LLDGQRAGDPEALERFRAHHPRLGGLSPAELASARIALHDAQLVIAREYGFASWSKLKARLDGLAAARRTRPFVKDPAWYEDRAHGLISVHQAGLPHALAQIREWHPKWSGASDAEILSAPFGLEDARLVYARQHGFDSWAAFTAHVGKLIGGAAEEPFMAAFEALQAADLGRLTVLLRVHPDLALARGTNGNSLLNLAASLWCGRAGRGLSEDEAFKFLQALLDAGADINQPNERGWTPLHQAGYANQVGLARRLLDAGAAVDREAHGGGGTPLVAALFWGHREVADFLAARAVVPDNLRVAAGLGRIDLARRFFAPGGALLPEAGQARGFYRPHSGFPIWRPTSAPQEILDEALVWACKSNRVEILPVLVDHGANVGADPYRGTPLLWGAYCGRLEAVRWLLDHGADVNQRATFGGPGHGQGVTALHLASQNGDLAMVKLLVERGADAGIADELYRSTPLGWADHFGRREVREYLATKK
jgi:ankyrin repeat protein